MKEVVIKLEEEHSSKLYNGYLFTYQDNHEAGSFLGKFLAEDLGMEPGKVYRLFCEEVGETRW